MAQLLKHNNMQTDGKYYRWSDAATRQSNTCGPTGNDAFGDYGLLPVRPFAPYKLGIMADGVAMYGQRAYDQLQSEGFTLPYVPDDPPATIWQYENPYITSQLPTVEKGDLLCPFGYELIQHSSGMIVQRASLEMALLMLENNMVDAWRIYNPLRNSETIVIANPDYEAGHAVHLAAAEAFRQAVANRFTVQFCYYYYPTLRVTPTVRWFRKDEPEGKWPVGRWLAEHEIPVDPSHPLAGNGGKKAFFQQARQEDYKDYSNTINLVMMERDQDQIKMLLGIK